LKFESNFPSLSNDFLLIGDFISLDDVFIAFVKRENYKWKEKKKKEIVKRKEIKNWKEKIGKSE